MPGTAVLNIAFPGGGGEARIDYSPGFSGLGPRGPAS